eukprot:evm.model.scf_298.5 EVM.evm.TU.scf_298.5   scf_298:23621-26085(+)
MSCPFRPQGSITITGRPPPEEDGARQCPARGTLNGGEISCRGGPKAGDEGDADKGARGGDGVSTSGGVCPLGFGTSQGPKFSSLHCPLCKCLFHECVRLAVCGHRYCRFCASRCRDCPTCGADVQGIEDDAEMQGLVDKYIDAHCVNHTIWELESGEPVDKHRGLKVDDPTGLQRCSATFFLQLGLRSYMSGNYVAARQRLLRCKAELHKLMQKGSQESSVDVALWCQLGAVCGVLGDCSRRCGDSEAAAHHYLDSVNHLKQAEGNDEATRELAVSLNKLGDLHFYGNDVQAAREKYAEALDVRRKQQQKSHSDEQVLEIAVSLTKVADADQVMIAAVDDSTVGIFED